MSSLICTNLFKNSRGLAKTCPATIGSVEGLVDKSEGAGRGARHLARVPVGFVEDEACVFQARRSNVGQSAEGGDAVDFG